MPRRRLFTALLALVLTLVAACSTGDRDGSEAERQFTTDQLADLIPPATLIQDRYDLVELEQFRGPRSDDEVDVFQTAPEVRDSRLGGYLVLYGAGPDDASGLEIIGYEVHLYASSEAASAAMRPLNELYGGPLGACSVSQVEQLPLDVGAEALGQTALRSCSNGELWTSQVISRHGNLLAVIYGSHEEPDGLDAIPELARSFADHLSNLD